MSNKQPYASLELTQDSIEALRAAFPPKYGQISADHITIRYSTESQAELFEPDSIDVIGYIDDGKGIEAVLVKIDGESFREDGNPWHITLSFEKSATGPKELDPYRFAPQDGKADKRKERPYSAVMSNALIRNALNPEMPEYKVEYLETPLRIKAKPQIIQPEPEQENNSSIDLG